MMDDLIGRLDSKRILLIDCFGTVLFRRVPAQRVRALLAARVSADVHENPLAVLSHLNDAWRSAELNATGHASSYDVAAALHGRLALDDAVTVERFCERYCAFEVEIETLATTPNSLVIDALRQADGVAIYLVSDTNLTRSMMRELLDRHGLGVLFDGIFVSSDGRSKTSGDIYPFLLSELGVSADECGMVGDNAHADIAQAKLHGIDGVLVTPGRWDGRRNGDERALDRELRSRLQELVRPAGPEDVFPEFALTLWFCMANLDLALRDAGHRQVSFLAREGLFLKQVFDLVQSASGRISNDRISTRYLMTSRASVFRLAELSTAALFDRLAQGPSTLGVGDALALTGLDIQISESMGFTQFDALTPEIVERLRSHRDAFASVDERRLEQHDLFCELLEQHVVNERLVVVDVGWKGTVQSEMRSLLDPAVELTGYYIGLSAEAPLKDESHKRALLFANRPHRTRYFQIFNHFRTLMEVLFGAPHGSVTDYERDDHGQVVARTASNELEALCHDQLVGPFQERCLRRLDELIPLLTLHAPSEGRAMEMVARHHARMMYRPTKAEVHFVGHLVQYDNFGLGSVEHAGVSRGSKGRGLRSHISGGGWPPLRMHQARRDWLRAPYAAYKTAQLWTKRLD